MFKNVKDNSGFELYDTDRLLTHCESKLRGEIINVSTVVFPFLLDQYANTTVL